VVTRKGGEMPVFLKGIRRPGGRTVEVEQHLINKTIVIPHAGILDLYNHGTLLVEPTETYDFAGSPRTSPVPVSCVVFGTSGGGHAYANQSQNQRLELFWGVNDKQLAQSSDVVLNTPDLKGYVKYALRLPDQGNTYLCAVFSNFYGITGSS